MNARGSPAKQLKSNCEIDGKRNQIFYWIKKLQSHQIRNQSFLLKLVISLSSCRSLFELFWINLLLLNVDSSISIFMLSWFSLFLFHHLWFRFSCRMLKATRKVKNYISMAVICHFVCAVVLPGRWSGNSDIATSMICMTIRRMLDFNRLMMGNTKQLFFCAWEFKRKP